MMLEGTTPKITFRKWLKRFLAAPRQELATNLMAGKLNISQKREICFLLTGEEPSLVKRGRPSTQDRDIQLILDYIDLKRVGRFSGETIKRILAKKYRLQGLGEVLSSTYYRALGRGRKLLQNGTSGKSILVCTGDTPKRQIICLNFDSLLEMTMLKIAGNHLSAQNCI